MSLKKSVFMGRKISDASSKNNNNKEFLMAEKVFVDGLRVRAKRENAPDWIKMRMSIKREELISWLQSRSEDWIEIDVKESRAGNLYAEVDTWKPNSANPTNSNPNNAAEDTGIEKTSFSDDVPF